MKKKISDLQQSVKVVKAEKNEILSKVTDPEGILSKGRVLVTKLETGLKYSFRNAQNLSL